MTAARAFGALWPALFCFACAVSAEPLGEKQLQPSDLSSPEMAPKLIAYKSTASRELFLHVFAPDPNSFPGVRPAILLFHGGGWVEGDALRFYDQARHFAMKGMVAISADYRIKSVDATAPKMALADASSAMRFVRANADALNIDLSRIAAGGGSAGGQLAAALATAQGFDGPEDNKSISKQPAALVLFNPVIDNGPGGYGNDRVADYWEAFSPLHNIEEGHPPTIILLGTADKLIPVRTATEYCQKVRAAGAHCVLQLYNGQPHAFFNRRRSELYFRKTLTAVDEFFRTLGSWYSAQS